MPYLFSAHIGYLFTELPLDQRVAAAQRAGFDAIEYPTPYALPVDRWQALLGDAQLPYIQFGLPSGDAAKGEKGIAIFPERRAEFRDSVTIGLDYAEALGVRMVHAMAGVLPAEQRRPEHWACYVENLALAAQLAAERGVTILVEAMSSGAVPNYFIETPTRAAEAIGAAGEDNLALLLDVFHTASVGLDVAATLRRYAGLLGHVHIADYPGRHEPGSAELDFNRITDVLQDVGYSGVLGCEYAPATSTAAGLGWLKSARRHR